ncbi:MAG: hypothetical protein LKG16_00950 [Bifidobacterium subtile]|jgi:hypothetical protein|nr:hypothetical protein [Bifidobacterium subtile]MCI1257793.1 hypothetical protein [Bifidobacterium subtile]
MRYDVTVAPDEDAWGIYVPAIDRATAARNLKEVDTMASDLIEIMTGSKNPELAVHLKLPDDIQAKLNDMQNLRRHAQELRERAIQEQADVIRKLHNSGMTYRDISTVLGLPYQRTRQRLTKCQKPGSCLRAKLHDAVNPCDDWAAGRKTVERMTGIEPA